ncbi:MAG TPA: caspase family protein [Usitatibacter sp.]|nr:caspase family protein [Usitatibacter sp.]
MAAPLSILCIHGVAHGDADSTLAPKWTEAIRRDIHRWQPDLEVKLDFLAYDDLFDHAPLNLAVYGEAFARLMASGAIHGLGEMLGGERAFGDIPELIRWTAGMIAQWAAEDELRDALRKRVLQAMKEEDYGVVCAHSLGSLISYDAFARNPDAIADKVYVTLGSQIGNPFVRDCFAGRIVPLEGARTWYHLYNDVDHVFTCPIRLDAANFTQVDATFDEPHNLLNHDPVCYFDHPNTQSRVWPNVSGAARPARMIRRTLGKLAAVARRPDRRALLVGINAYPDPANRLEGCVNDVFLMSAVLQECGLAAEDIRVVLDERATTDGILERLHWLLDDVPANGERFLFYSGHGAQIPTYDIKGEVDHLDECLVPYDFDWSAAHAIRDKQFAELYSQLRYDARFVAVFDCCHSGGLTRDGGPRIRGINPPDDIRHRMLEWDPRLGMWRKRELPTPNATLAASADGAAYLGRDRSTFRLGRGVALRGLANRTYDRERRSLGHYGPYLPVILEACREQQFSYEYRDGAASYGAFTFALARSLRDSRALGRNPTFAALSRLAAEKLKTLRYDQDPCFVGPRSQLERPIPWATAARPRRRGKVAA